MTDKARELLERAWKELLDAYEGSNGERVAKEIHAYLAQPEVKREPLSEEEIDQKLLGNVYYSRSFTAGVRFAEKHHGIGGKND